MQQIPSNYKIVFERCKRCKGFYIPDAPDDWGTHVYQVCNPCWSVVCDILRPKNIIHGKE